MADLSSPGFVVTVISTRAEIKLKGTATSLGKALDKLSVVDLTPRISSLEFVDDEKKQDTLKISVDNHDLFFFENPMLMKGNLLRFYFGFPGRIFGPRIHVIDNMRGFQSLEVTAVEETALLNKVKTRIWKNTTRVDIVKKIVEEGAFLQVVNTDIDASGLSDESPRDWQQSKSDYLFIKRLAEKVDYEFYVQGDTLHFHPKRLGRRPHKTYEWFYGNGDLKAFSIEEFSVTDNVSGVVAKGRDPIEKKNLTAQASDSDTERDTLGSQGATKIKKPGLRSDYRFAGSQDFSRVAAQAMAGLKIVPSPETDPATLKKEADTYFKKFERMQVKASGTILGDPLLPAKSVIEIKGVSRMFSGKYYVTRHAHSLDSSGGYEGKMKLIRNALDAMPTEDPPTLDRAKAKENLTATRGPRERMAVRLDPDGRTYYQAPPD